MRIVQLQCNFFPSLSNKFENVPEFSWNFDHFWPKTHLNHSIDNFFNGIPYDLPLLPHLVYLPWQNGMQELWHLQQQSFIGIDHGSRPVYHFAKEQQSAVGHYYWNTAGLQRLQKPETAQPPAPRNQAEGGVGQKGTVIPPEMEIDKIVLFSYLNFYHWLLCRKAGK